MERGVNNTSNVAHNTGLAVWFKGTTVSGDGAGSVTGISSDLNNPTTKTGTWTIKTDLDGVYYTNAKIRVSANDGNGANQAGYGDSAVLTNDTLRGGLDMKDPTNAAGDGDPTILVDATTSPATLTLDAADDDANLKMILSLNSDIDLSPDGVNGDSGTWIDYASSKLWILETDPDTVYIQFKDDKGNTFAVSPLLHFSTATPETSLNPMIQDTSNVATEEWRLFVVWKAVAATDPATFGSYEIYRSENGGAYAFLKSESSRAVNFYTDITTAYNTDYAYKIFTKDTDGSQSYYSTAISGKADGVQGDGEGGGGGDETAPVITHDYAGVNLVTKTSTTATITFTATDAGRLSDSYVGYSADPDITYANEQGVPTMIAFGETHTVTLVGLDENATYHYKIKSRDPSGNTGTS